MSSRIPLRRKSQIEWNVCTLYVKINILCIRLTVVYSSGRCDDVLAATTTRGIILNHFFFVIHVLNILKFCIFIPFTNAIRLTANGSRVRRIR